jgi:hypothetical protein
MFIRKSGKYAKEEYDGMLVLIIGNFKNPAVWSM